MPSKTLEKELHLEDPIAAGNARTALPNNVTYKINNEL